jgi:hypothetical protein
MPYQTPSAGQYTQIKRLQSNQTAYVNESPLKFRAPNSYSVYQSGIQSKFGDNVLESNKFLQGLPEFETIGLYDTKFGYLRGSYTCPIPSNVQPYVKLYEFVAPTTTTYDYGLYSGTGDQDLFVSYPNTPFGVEAIQAAMTSDYCEEGGGNLSQYFSDWSLNIPPFDVITNMPLNEGDVVYVLILSYEPGEFAFQIVYD